MTRRKNDLPVTPKPKIRKRTTVSAGDNSTLRRKNIVSSEEKSVFTQMDFEASVEAFVREQKVRHLSPKTIKWQLECLMGLNRWLTENDLPSTPTKITSKSLKDYVYHMLEEKKLSPATVNGRILTIKSFFEYLTNEGIITTNPNTLKRVKQRKNVIQAFSHDQIRDLLRAPDRNTFTGVRDYAMMLLMLETGIRVSELAGIVLDDIKWSENKIILLGKGDKERVVPFQRRVHTALKNYVEIRGHIHSVSNLFVTIDNIPMVRRTIQERISDYGKKMNITGVRVSPHTFRHTFAKLYIKNGGDPFTLQAILGHSTLDMVRNYVNMFSEDVQEQHRKYSPIEHLTF